jgi:hypothetical protein
LTELNDRDALHVARRSMKHRRFPDILRPFR